jgi:hypothetical protein
VAGLGQEHEQGGVRVHEQHLDQERACGKRRDGGEPPSWVGHS